MNRQYEIDYWLSAAKRADQSGEPATAISFRNIAYLLEHVEWKPVTPELEDVRSNTSESLR